MLQKSNPLEIPAWHYAGFYLLTIVIELFLVNPEKFVNVWLICLLTYSLIYLFPYLFNQ